MTAAPSTPDSAAGRAPDAAGRAPDAAGRAADVAAVLWDCDGVLQHGIRSAVAHLTALVGPDAFPVLIAEERHSLRGAETLRDCVTRLIDRLELTVDVDEVLGLWDRYELDGDALDVLAGVRAAGYPCYLATNQQDYRRDGMRPRYDHLVDGSFYSCEMRVAKPDPGFFRHIVTALARPAATLLFLDDLAENVAAARAEGLRAELVEPGPVAPQLIRVLARHGIAPAHGEARPAVPGPRTAEKSGSHPESAAE